MKETKTKINNNVLTIWAYNLDDINHEEIILSMEYTIEKIDDVKCMYAKTGSGNSTEVITKVELYGLMGATGSVVEVREKIIKSWVNNSYLIDVIDEDGNIIDK